MTSAVNYVKLADRSGNAAYSIFENESGFVD